VTEDCVEIWQRATIRDALPEEYKDNVLKFLKEKTAPKLLRELQEKFADAPGLCKKLQKET
jgi:hypothetical protein